jgi:hypothetical protein
MAGSYAAEGAARLQLVRPNKRVFKESKNFNADQIHRIFFLKGQYCNTTHDFWEKDFSWIKLPCGINDQYL